MLISFIFDDLSKAKTQALSYAEAAQKKKPDALLLKLDADKFKEAQINELVESQTLFVRKYIVSFSGIFQDSDAKEAFFEFLDEFKKAEHLFVLADSPDALSKQELSKLQSASFEFKLQEANLKQSAQKANIFKLSDAFLSLNKAELWRIYSELKRDFEAEELYSNLLWTLKNLKAVLAQNGNKPSKMSPFVFKKAQMSIKQIDRQALSVAFEEFVDLPRKATVKNISLYEAV